MEHFFNDLIKKYVIYFGVMFNDIKVERLAPNGTTTQIIRVPLEFIGRQAFIERINQNPDLLKATSTTLPRMTFEITGYKYTADRKLPSTQKNFSQDLSNSSIVRSQYVPVPYDINFSLHIFSRNMQDASRIVEQILPLFAPQYTQSMNLIPAMNITMDIPLVLNSVGVQDTFEGPLQTRRYVSYQLDFTMRAYFYGPIARVRMIREVLANIFTSMNAQVLLTIDPLSNVAFHVGDSVYQGNSVVNNAVGIVTRANSSVIIVNTTGGSFQGNSQLRVTTSNAYANVTGTRIVSLPTETVTVRPGLTVDGLPTSDPDLSVGKDEIQPNDNYGFLIDFALNEDL